MIYIVGILFLVMSLMGWENHKLTKTNEGLNQTIGTLNTSLDTEKKNLKICSDNTADLVAADAKKAEQIRIAKAAAAKKSKEHEGTAQGILTTPPDPTLSELDQLKDELNKYFVTRNQPNEKTIPNPAPIK